MTKKDYLKPRGSRPLVEDVPEFSVLKCVRSGALRKGDQSTVAWQFRNEQIGHGEIRSHGNSITLDYRMRSGDEELHREKVEIGRAVRPSGEPLSVPAVRLTDDSPVICE